MLNITKKTFLILIPVLVTLLVLSFFSLFKTRIMDFYYLNNYKSELDCIRKGISAIAKNNYKSTRELSTTDSNILRPAVFERLQKILNSYDLNSLRVKYLTKGDGSGPSEVFVDIFFGNNVNKVFHVKMIYQYNKWLIDSISIG